MGTSVTDLVGSYDNLNDPKPLSNEVSTIFGVVITFQVLSWSCGLLRLWTRYRVARVPGWDDFFVVASLVTTSVGCITILVSANHYGLGEHFLHLGGTQGMKNYLKTFYISNGTYILSTTLIKLALLLQYLRVFDRGTPPWIFSVGLTVFVSLWGLAYTIVTWFPCSPIEDYWSLNPDANCWGFASQDSSVFVASFESHTAINMVLDFVIWLVPAQLLLRAGVETKVKRGLLGVLALGGLANAASIWRMVTIVEHKAATSPTFDPSWYGCVSIILAAAEVDLAVICASVPVFWPVLQARGLQIFITREVQVTHESRAARKLDGTSDDDDVELQSGAVPPAVTGEGDYRASVGAGPGWLAEGGGMKRNPSSSSEDTLRNVKSGGANSGSDSSAVSSLGRKLREKL